MKLRNKKTGEIIEFDAILPVKDVSGDSVAHLEYNSLTELNKEWEDYKEPKEYWYYDTTKNGVDKITHLEDKGKDQAIGNYFETKEEAEKAVERLRAWKRLKDKGVEFYGWRRNHTGTYDLLARWEDRIPRSYEVKKDLDLIFGGEV